MSRNAEFLNYTIGGELPRASWGEFWPARYSASFLGDSVQIPAYRKDKQTDEIDGHITRVEGEALARKLAALGTELLPPIEQTGEANAILFEAKRGVNGETKQIISLEQQLAVCSILGRVDLVEYLLGINSDLEHAATPARALTHLMRARWSEVYPNNILSYVKVDGEMRILERGGVYAIGTPNERAIAAQDFNQGLNLLAGEITRRRTLPRSGS